MSNEKNYQVYVHTCITNGKKYVGVTGNSLKVRKGRNWEGYRGSPYFYNAIQKYGSENFVSEVVYDGLTKTEASAKERELIALYDTLNPEKGFNLHRGGYRVSETFDKEAREKSISNTLKKQRSTPEYRAIMAERMKAVWADPDRRSKMIDKRKGKMAGKKHNAKIRGISWDDGSPVKYPDGREALSMSDISNIFGATYQSVMHANHRWLSKHIVSSFIAGDNVILMKTTEDDNTWILKKVNCWEVLELPITKNGMDIGGWIISSRAAKGLKFRIRALAEGSTTIPEGSTLK